MCVDGLHTFCWIHHSPESMSSTAEPDLYFPMFHTFLQWQLCDEFPSQAPPCLFHGLPFQYSSSPCSPTSQFLVFQYSFTLYGQSYSHLLLPLWTVMMTPKSHIQPWSLSWVLERHLQLPADNVTRISYRFLRITIHKWSYNLTFPFRHILAGEQNVSLWQED